MTDSGYLADSPLGQVAPGGGGGGGGGVTVILDNIYKS